MTHFVKQEDPATAEREPTLEGLCGLKNILHVMRHFNLEVAEYEPGLWSLQQAKSSVAWQSENDDQNERYHWRSGAVKAACRSVFKAKGAIADLFGGGSVAKVCFDVCKPPRPDEL